MSETEDDHEQKEKKEKVESSMDDRSPERTPKSEDGGLSLTELLEGPELLDRIEAARKLKGGQRSASSSSALQGMCIECDDVPAVLVCLQCEDQFCEVCFATQHRKGNRVTHKNQRLADIIPEGKKGGKKTKAKPAPVSSFSSSSSASTPEDEEAQALASVVGQGKVPKKKSKEEEEEDEKEAAAKEKEKAKAKEEESKARGSHFDDDDDDSETREGRRKKDKDRMEDSEKSDDESDDDSGPYSYRPSYGFGGFLSRFSFAKKKKVKLPTGDDIPCGDWWKEKPPADYFVDRAKYTPLRLPLDQRKYMRLLRAALNVNEYTDKIDFISPKEKAKRVFAQLKDICAVLTGLVVATDYKIGQKMLKDNDFKEQRHFFSGVFELGRRHKIRNPEKMRSQYGKLIYLLQDAVSPDVQDIVEFSCVIPIKTVYTKLADAGIAVLLQDKYLALATGEILAEGKGRPEIDRAIRLKENAITHIAKKYMNDKISEEDLRQCLLSIGDNHSYLRFNRDPCDKVLEFLTTYFSPDKVEEPFTLAISGGQNGARLTHNHSVQYYFALQTLTLWRDILHDMYKLWMLAEEDLLDPANVHELKQTGQGLNRIQQAPRTAKFLRQILYNCQKKLGQWVGSSVIHLGDNNVPNALNFIDKYNQVARILNPIVTTLRLLPDLMKKESTATYVNSTFGSVHECKMAILTDFFRSAFDGSGADNFYAAGSCIDGRLTSAWHWCSQLAEKPYYPIFLLTGFVGFDGKYWGE